MANTILMHVAYTARGIRLASVYRHGAGWVNGRKTATYFDAPQVIFGCIEDAMNDVERRNPPQPIEWRVEEVAQ